MIIRLLLWNLYESKTTIDELRTQLPQLESPSAWIWNEAAERFGLIWHGDEWPDWLEPIRDRIGADAEVAEEFDLL